AGSLALRGRLGGTLAQPELAATLTAAALTLRGEPLATPLPASLEIDWRQGRLATSGALLGLIGVSGGGPLRLDAGDLDLRLEVPDLPALAAALGADPALPLAGSLSARLAVTGGLVGGEPLRARLTAERADLRLAGRDLALLEPAEVEIDAGGIAIRSLYLGEPGTDSEIFVAGSVALGDEGLLDLRLQARLAAALLGDALPGVAASGDLELLAAVRGTAARPRFSGQARVAEGRVRLPEFPHTFERVRALILLDPDRIVVDSFAADLGGGRLRGDGSVLLGAAGAPPEYRFQLAAEGVVLRYPAGWLIEADADLALVSLPQGRALRGSIELARAFYLRDFPADLGQLLVRLLERQRLEAAATDEALAATALQVTIVAPRSLRIRNNVADLRASADLALRGTLAQPTVFGRIEAEPGGKIVYAGTEYAIERGRVTLANPARIEPVIDLDARTKVDQYELQLRLAGTLERLDVSFSSDPPLPSLDVFGLLAVGEALPTEGAAPVGQEATTAQGGSFGAEAILYNQAASIVSSRVQGLFGLDKLRIDPLTTSRNVVSSARVTVGKRLSRDVYVTYTLDPASTEQQQVQVEWQINEGLVLVLTQNGEESYAADLRWQRRF
ncbi:MAG TPA: translocation/assembly module TamB domain-containing protein, partial [Thermoanaerobaculia bacterium]|nr:translocation/assembly module TamB domain-containing protein [Thermoanaerobaculia bacterium]